MLMNDDIHKKKIHLLVEQDVENTVLPLGSGCGLLHSGVEEGVAEEVQGAAENHSGIVSCLEAGNQQGVLANSMWVLVRR